MKRINLLISVFIAALTALPAMADGLSGGQILSPGSINCSAMPGLTGDATSLGGSCATILNKIQGTTITGTTGSGAAVLGTSPSISSPSLTTPIIAAGTPSGAGVLGYSAGTLNYGDSSANHTVVSTDQVQTISNKSITSSSGQFVTQLSMAGASAVGGPAVLMYQAPGGGCPWLVLGPDGTFISTSGTTTCGLQEAINYASANAYALHVIGRGYAQPGGALPQNLMATSTITVPRSLQGTIIFDNVVLTVIPSNQGDGMVIDTSELMQFDFRSLLLYQGNGYALRFKPTTANAPDANISEIINKFYFGSVVVQPNTGLTPLGAVAFDLTSGNVEKNFFQFGEICGNCFASPVEGVNGIAVINPQSSTYFRENHIEVNAIYGFSAYGIREGTSTTNQANLYNNQWYINSVDLQNGTTAAFDTFGRNDTANIGVTSLNGSPTHALVFESGATSNNFILRQSAASGTAVVDTSGGNNWTDMSNSLQKIGTTVTQSVNAGGDFALLQSTASSSENAVRIDSTQSTSGSSLKLSNSGNNKQVTIRINSVGGLELYSGQIAGGSSTSGALTLQTDSSGNTVARTLSVNAAIPGYVANTAFFDFSSNVGRLQSTGSNNSTVGSLDVFVGTANFSTNYRAAHFDTSGNTTLLGLNVGNLAVSSPVYTDASKNLTSTAPAGYSAVLSGTSGSIGGGALVAGACSSGTATVTGAATSMVALTDPNTYPGDGAYWDAYVSGANTVTVKVCATIALTPTASTYNVRVLQ